MTTTISEKFPVLNRRIDTERLIITICILTGIALVVIAQDLILPILRAALNRIKFSTPFASFDMLATPKDILLATPLKVLRRMAISAGLCPDRNKEDLIEDLLEINVDRANDYRSEVPGPAARNRAEGLL